MARCALVTGGTGFVGFGLVGHLRKRGWKVHAIVREESDVDRVAALGCRAELHTVENNVESMRGILRTARPDVVFHLSALFLSEHQPQDIRRLIESNVLFGVQLVEAMTLEGVLDLINTGTSWQHYGGREYSPVNLYAATKQAFDALLQYYVEARDLRAITLELFDVYGPNDPRQKLLQLLLRAAETGTAVELSPGQQEIELVHVDDVARAYAIAADLLARGSKGSHDRYGLPSRSRITVTSLVRELEKACGIQVPVVWGRRPYRQREVMKPWEPNATLPGWEPQIQLREGLRGLRAAR